MQSEDANTQDNYSNQEDKKTTVSLRSMSTSIWKLAKIGSAKKGMTMTQYISYLIEKDSSNE